MGTLLASKTSVMSRARTRHRIPVGRKSPGSAAGLAAELVAGKSLWSPPWATSWRWQSKQRPQRSPSFHSHQKTRQAWFYRSLARRPYATGINLQWWADLAKRLNSCVRWCLGVAYDQCGFATFVRERRCALSASMSFKQPACPTGQLGVALYSARDVFEPRLCWDRRVDELRKRHQGCHRQVGVYFGHPQGGEACGAPVAGAFELVITPTKSSQALRVAAGR